ncbi:MAG: glycosyltransferase [Coriobacteriia bacterium]|nr:glycosyltransferase [Coriobacteriia bacterium]
MRILILGSAHSIALEQWVAEMTARGHEILVLSPYNPRPGLAQLTESTEGQLRIPLLGFALRILRLRRRIRTFRPDVVHAHGALNYALWGVLTGFPRVWVTCWGSDVLVAPAVSRLSRWKVRRGLRGASYVTATSASLLEVAEQIAGRRLKGEVLHWGVDAATFRPGPRAAGAEGLRILSLRAHKDLYNIDAILRAFAAVRSAHGDARLVVAHQGERTDQLKSLAAVLRIQDAVDFIGWVDQDELPALYRSADVYVSVPSSDGAAVSNLEAMASGVAVVASDLPSTREWIEDRREGLLVPAGESDALAAALLELGRDSELRESLARTARQKVEERGSRSAQMDRASEIYAELAQGRVR